MSHERSAESSIYGHQYTLKTITKYEAPALETLECQGVKFVRMVWVDFSNTTRYRVIPISHFRKIMAAAKPSISIVSAAPALFFNNVPPGYDVVGENPYVPDMASLRLTTYAPGHATLFGWFEPKHEDVPLPPCPRKLLRKIVDEAAAVDVHYLVGFETEFILLQMTDNMSIKAVNEHPWSASRALLSGSPEATCMEAIVNALEQCGITVEMYHAEAAPGQYEIVTAPLSPLEAADALIVTRETILNIANSHGLHATFAPRVFPDDCGSACHSHISVHKEKAGSRVAVLPEGLDATEMSFLSGVLEHLPAICAITLPITASYARMVDGAWTGGTYVSWSRDHRETPIRLCGSPEAGAGHFEFRPLDGTANPYIALAAILGAGNEGIRSQSTLSMHACTKESPAEMSEEKRRNMGVTRRLPLNLVQARSLFEADHVLKRTLGRIGDTWVGVNQALEQCLDDKAKEYPGGMRRLIVDHF